MNRTQKAAAEGIPTRVIEGLGAIAAKSQVAARTADDYVRHSPWQSVALVGAAAVAAGFVASRDRSASRRSWI